MFPIEPSVLLPALVNDSVRYIHLLAVAVGIGTSFLADLCVLHRIKTPLAQVVLDDLHRFHRLVTWSLIAMWVSGAVLVYLRTGFVWDNFSPKLIAKIVVVSALTINSLAINTYVIPLLRRSLGTALVDLPLGARVSMSLVAGISTCSWLLALALGSSAVLKVSGAEVQIPLLAGSYLAAAVISVLAAVAMGRSVSAVPAK